MDFFAKQRVLAWSVVILIVLNLGTLATLWMNHLGRPGGNRPPGGGPPARARDFLEREMGFDGVRKKKLESLQSRHMNQMSALQDQIDDLKRRMMDELLKTSPDGGSVDALAGKIGEIEASRSRLTYSHLKKIKALCTPQQAERFDGLMRELLHILKPPDPHDPSIENRREARRPPPQERIPGRSPAIRQDADGDGKISVDEWVEHHREMFRTEIDLDGDGYVSEAEWSEDHRRRPDDANRSGPAARKKKEETE